MSSFPGLIFLVDAFADGPFTGNPAGVCVLAERAGDSWMQASARGGYPKVEVVADRVGLIGRAVTALEGSLS